MSNKLKLSSLILTITTTVLLSKEPLFTEGINVGTTLFTRADCLRECWSDEGIALLTSRMILEDLLPSPAVLVMDSNEFVNDLVDYFRLILDVIRAETSGKSKHLTLIALTDLLGGYMYHAVVPMAKYSYYAGIIDYDSMDSLMQLFAELKFFLRTNGRGWAKPMKQAGENNAIERIVLKKSAKDREDACNGLVLRENETSEYGNCGISVPMPFLDSNDQPVAIALPYKSCGLYNVGANTSAYIVMKFFINSYECLVNKNAPPDSMERFIDDFCMWIEKTVEPRLHDEKFYAAFGGVLRVRNTLRRLGVKQGRIEMEENDDLREVVQGAGDDRPIQGRSGGGDHPDDVFQNKKMSKMNMIVLALIATIALWFLLGSTFICYKIRSSRQKKKCTETCPSSTMMDDDDNCDQSRNTRSSSSRRTTSDSDGRGNPRGHQGGGRHASPARITPSRHEETGPHTSTPYRSGMDDSHFRSAMDHDDSHYRSTTDRDDSRGDESHYRSTTDDDGRSRRRSMIQERSLFHDTEPHERIRLSMIRQAPITLPSDQNETEGSRGRPSTASAAPRINRAHSNQQLDGDTTDDEEYSRSFGRGTGPSTVSTPRRSNASHGN